MNSSDKKNQINRYLFDEYVIVYLIPSCPGVSLPSHLMGENEVALKLSRLFRGAMELRDNCIMAELLFGQEFFTCLIPYESIYAIKTVKQESIVFQQGGVKKITPQSQKTSFQKLGAQKIGIRSRLPKSAGHLRRVK